MMASLNATAAMSGNSATALALRQRTRQRADASRAQRATMIEEILAHGVRPGGGMASGGGGSAGPGGGAVGSTPTHNGPGRGLVTIRTPNGGRVTVAANYASRFSGLMNDLW